MNENSWIVCRVNTQTHESARVRVRTHTHTLDRQIDIMQYNLFFFLDMNFCCPPKFVCVHTARAEYDKCGKMKLKCFVFLYHQHCTQVRILDFFRANPIWVDSDKFGFCSWIGSCFFSTEFIFFHEWISIWCHLEHLYREKLHGNA